MGDADATGTTTGARPEELSYRLHEHLEASTDAYDRLPSAYTAPDSLDNWRHDRFRAMALPMVRVHPEWTWLTIGDGRYGADANFLSRHGADVLATSLTDHTLVEAQRSGRLVKAQAANAEQLPFDDEAFDVVFCKEAYHHLPRPPVGFYEMLRVSRHGVVLIEPIDHRRGGVLGVAKQKVKHLLRGDETGLFEPDGNYLYRLAPRELDKMMTALGYHVVAHHYFNDFWHPRLAERPATRWRWPRLVTDLGIAVQDLACHLGLLGYGLGALVAFKTDPSAELVRALQSTGYRLVDLPRNPYA